MLTPAEEAQIRALLVRNIDLHKRRVVNAADAVDDGDYVTKRQIGTVIAGSSKSVLSHAQTHQESGTDEISVTNLHGLLYDEQNPLPHASDHQTGGDDVIAIDTLGAASDNTNLNVSATAHGLTPKLPADATKFLNGNGLFSTPSSSSGIMNNFRLTLSSGNAIYRPLALIPSSTDTTAETCTFTNGHGWTDGTIVTPSTTVGGLTTGTIYYIHVVSATVVSFHTTLAAALAGTSPVNLTANITGTIVPSGVTNTTLYFTPFRGNSISIYDGVSAWATITSAEVSIALGTLTSALCYDLFATNVAGVLTLALLAWTSATARATALVLQNGVWVKSGATASLYVGTIYTDTTTTTIDDAGGIKTQTGGKRYVWNAWNRVVAPIRVIDLNGAARWSYNTFTVRQANGAAGNKVEFITGLSEEQTRCSIVSSYTTSAAPNLEGSVGVGLDSTTTMVGRCSAGTRASGDQASLYADYAANVAIGYHYFAWLEEGSGNAGTVSWNPSAIIYGMPSSIGGVAASLISSSILIAEVMC